MPLPTHVQQATRGNLSTLPSSPRHHGWHNALALLLEILPYGPSLAIRHAPAWSSGGTWRHTFSSLDLRRPSKKRPRKRVISPSRFAILLLRSFSDCPQAHKRGAYQCIVHHCQDPGNLRKHRLRSQKIEECFKAYERKVPVCILKSTRAHVRHASFCPRAQPQPPGAWPF
jgi:hypothetical protein